MRNPALLNLLNKAGDFNLAIDEETESANDSHKEFTLRKRVKSDRKPDL